MSALGGWLPGARPLLLDLYGGEGGAGKGYADAGWDVFGVDNDPARIARYPLPAHDGSAIDVLEALLSGGAVPFTTPAGERVWARLDAFAAVHASPPCQGYSRATVALPDREQRYDRLIAETRALLVALGLPYVIENVEQARSELIDPVMLCGRMFGLSAIDDDGTPLVLDRHRLFESSVRLEVPTHLPHDRTVQVAGVYGGARRDKVEARTVRKGGYVPPSLEVLRALIGAPWMSEKGCFLSIPPAYGEYIGRQLMTHALLERAGLTGATS